MILWKKRSHSRETNIILDDKKRVLEEARTWTEDNCKIIKYTLYMGQRCGPASKDKI